MGQTEKVYFTRQEEYLDLFLNYLRGKERSDNTIETYEREIRAFYKWVKPYNPSYKIFRVNAVDYKNKLEKNKISRKTINKKLSALSSYNSFLVKSGFQEKLEITDDIFMKVQTTIASPAKITEEEVNIFFGKLLSEESKREHAVACVMAYAGARVSEAINIKFSDINFEKNKLRLLGKGNKERTIPMGKKLVAALKSYIELERDNSIDNEYVFISYTGKQIDRTIINKAFAKYSKVITPHQLRHFYCSFLVNQKDISLSDVANLAGHASIQTTAIYTNPTEKKLIEAVDKF